MAETWPADGCETLAGCPICGFARSEALYAGLRDELFGAPGEWNLHRCLHCEVVYLNPRPTPASIGLAYEGYYTHEAVAHGRRRMAGRWEQIEDALLDVQAVGFAGRDPQRAAARTLLRVVPHLRSRVNRGHRSLGRASQRQSLLDVGSGNGAFLRRMARLGWEIQGLEPDKAAAAEATAAGVPTRVGTLPTDGLAVGTYDAVTLSHTIEHVHDPMAVLRACRALLRPGGSLWIATPNLDASGHKEYGENWRGLEIPRHLVLFRYEALAECLASTGFSDVQRLVPPLHTARASAALARAAGCPWRLRLARAGLHVAVDHRANEELMLRAR